MVHTFVFCFLSPQGLDTPKRGSAAAGRQRAPSSAAWSVRLGPVLGTAPRISRRLLFWRRGISSPKTRRGLAKLPKQQLRKMNVVFFLAARLQPH